MKFDTLQTCAFKIGCDNAEAYIASRDNRTAAEGWKLMPMPPCAFNQMGMVGLFADNEPTFLEQMPLDGAMVREWL